MSAATDAPEIALLVLNWNGADLLRRHLPQVVDAARAASVPTRAFVVDNASEDGSHDVVRGFDDVGWIPMPDNRKLLAYNDAVAQIQCSAFMMLNNDLSPPRNAVDGLWEVMRDRPDVFAVGGLVWDVLTDQLESGPTTLRWEREWVVDRAGRADADGIVDVGYVSGGAGLFRRDRFLELGGFWPTLPSMYWEDTELGLRAWLHGWRSLYHPGLVFDHESGATTRHAISDRRRTFGVYQNRRLAHVALLLDRGDLREWIRGELSRSVRKPYYWPAALTLLPRLPAAIRQRRRLRARCGPVSVADLERRWSGNGG